MMLSFIVPTYNEEKYILKCLASLKNQKTRHRYEIIVVDAKSKDNTVKIAGNYADKILLSDIGSVALQRNAGARAAKGKYLVFVDADTQVFADYVESALCYMRKGYSAISFGFEFDRKAPKYVMAQRITNEYLYLKSIIGRTTLPGFNMVMPKAVFYEVGGFKNVVLEDIDISQKLQRNRKTAYILDKKVITSSRKLDKMGMLEVLKYYTELDISKNRLLSRYKDMFKYDRYIHVR